MKIYYIWPLLLFLSACKGRMGKELPYECGFVVGSKAGIEEVWGPELRVAGYQAGDTVAFVGASNGYRAGMLSVITDSLHIVLEDIDSLCLNATELVKVRRFYEGVRGEPLTNTFELVLGNEHATLLPRRAFDKVTVTASFHHFSAPEAMLADLKGSLKTNGRLYIIENTVEVTGERRKRYCEHPLKSEVDLRKQFEAAGFEVLEVQSLHKDFTKMFVLGASK